MRLNQPLLAELGIEAATTRAMLESVPEAALDWAPHARSRPLRELVVHIAGIPGHFLAGLERDEVDRLEDGFPAARVADVVAHFNDGVARGSEVLARLTDEELLAPWRYKVRGELVFELPRLVVVRTTALNHLIHHRGQLSVYLRLLDVPLPSVYGPTADSST